MSLFFRRAALLAGMLTVLAMLSLSPAAQAPARSAFDILEVGRWSNPPKKVNPLAAHHTYHSAAMNCDVGYTIYLPPNCASVRYPVVYWLPGGGCNEEPDSLSIAQGLLGGIDAAIRKGKLPPLLFVIVNGGRYTRYYDSLDGSIMIIGSEDGLLKWTEQLHTSMVKLKISHEVEIVGGVGHDFGAPATGIYEHQFRGLRYAADRFVLPQP